MGVVQVELPEELQALVDRQISEGRIADAQSFLTEAARRFAEDLELDDELIEIARRGIDDIKAGRFITIENEADAEAWRQETMARVRERLTDHQT